MEHRSELERALKVVDEELVRQREAHPYLPLEPVRRAACVILGNGYQPCGSLQEFTRLFVRCTAEHEDLLEEFGPVEFGILAKVLWRAVRA